jgi:hypothetical protein
MLSVQPSTDAKTNIIYNDYNVVSISPCISCLEFLGTNSFQIFNIRVKMDPKSYLPIWQATSKSCLPDRKLPANGWLVGM